MTEKYILFYKLKKISKKQLTNEADGVSIMEQFAVVAELAYAHDSGSCPCTWVGVQVPSTASYRIPTSLAGKVQV